MPDPRLVQALSMGPVLQQQPAADPRWQRLVQQMLAGQQQPAPQTQQDIFVHGTPDEGTAFLESLPPGAASMRAYEPTRAEGVGNWIYDTFKGLGLPGVGDKMRQTAMEESPLAIAQGAQETAQALGTGDYGSAALTGAGALLSAVPIPVPGAKGAIRDVAEQGLDVAAQAVRRNVGMEGRTYAAPALRGLDPDDHPAMVSPSVTSTKARAVDSDEEFVPTGLDTMRQDPEKFKSNMELMRNPKNYPGMQDSMTQGDPDSIAKHATDQIMSNLGFFIGKAQPEDWAGLSWYESAHKLARLWADEHGINDASAVGAIAALSPQADWNINVHLAKQLIDRFQNRGNLGWGPEMGDVGKMLISREAEKNIKAIGAGKQGIATTAPIIEAIRGKSMGELTDPAEIGMFARIHEEAFGDPLQGGGRGFRLFNPDGTFGDFKKTKAGQLSKPSWNSGPMVGNAVKALMADGDRQLIGKGLGGAHKVRSFYNNILNPGSKRRDVTMDSHAIEAAWMGLFPTAKDHGLATGTANSNPFGSFGTYGLYADGYRRVADDLSRIKGREIRPNQLQSVIWEMKRKLFEGVDKNPVAVEKINKTWQDYNRGTISLRQAQSDVWDIAEEVSGNARAAAEQR